MSLNQTANPNPPKPMMRSASDLASTVAATRERILVVDDDQQIRESLRKVLQTEGYEVLLAAAGQEGIEIFERRGIDLVLLDINLPGNSGWEVFGALTSSNPFLPIIIITGREGQQDLATLAGVGALMEKPLDVPLLLKAIAELIVEESETHMKRMTGLRRDLRYVPPGITTMST
jgi:DNA-binding response OmpR family regulator